jgi:hypothetical protein
MKCKITINRLCIGNDVFFKDEIIDDAKFDAHTKKQLLDNKYIEYLEVEKKKR